MTYLQHFIVGKPRPRIFYHFKHVFRWALYNAFAKITRVQKHSLTCKQVKMTALLQSLIFSPNKYEIAQLKKKILYLSYYMHML